nr:hypothetical protein [Angustibacter aerolatus]
MKEITYDYAKDPDTDKVAASLQESLGKAGIVKPEPAAPGRVLLHRAEQAEGERARLGGLGSGLAERLDGHPRACSPPVAASTSRSRTTPTSTPRSRPPRPRPTAPSRARCGRPSTRRPCSRPGSSRPASVASSVSPARRSAARAVPTARCTCGRRTAPGAYADMYVKK